MGRKKKYVDDQTRLANKRETAMRSYWKHRDKRIEKYNNDKKKVPLSPLPEESSSSSSSSVIITAPVPPDVGDKEEESLAAAPVQSPQVPMEVVTTPPVKKKKSMLERFHDVVDKKAEYVEVPKPIVIVPTEPLSKTLMHEGIEHPRELVEYYLSEKIKYPNAILRDDGIIEIPTEDEEAYEREQMRAANKDVDRIVLVNKEKPADMTKLKKLYNRYKKEEDELNDGEEYHATPLYDDDDLY